LCLTSSHLVGKAFTAEDAEKTTGKFLLVPTIHGLLPEYIFRRVAIALDVSPILFT